MYERIIQAVLNQPWAILPEKLAAIEAFLTLKAAGGQVTGEEIAAATGGRRAAPAQTSPEATVAVIPIYGTIHQHAGVMADYSGGVSTDGVTRALRLAMADPAVSAVVFDIDSPGGNVYGVQELWAEIMGWRETKPLVACANSLAASAAYYLASAANELWVTPSGEVGSIGVYMAHVDYSQAYEKEGIKVSYIAAGRYKVEANPTEPLGDEARAALQEVVDEYYEAFVGAVAKGRGRSVAEVRGGFGEGRLVTARRAKTLGMVDEVGTLDQAAGRAAKLARERERDRARQQAALGQAQADAIRLGLAL